MDVKKKLFIASGERITKVRGLRRLTIRCKISYEDILYNTGNIDNIL